MKRNIFFVAGISVIIVVAWFVYANKTTERVIAIGIDGATWDIIQPMIDNGELPAIKKLIDSGISGHLASIEQPVVPAAWISFTTGRESGETGIFDFVNPIPNSYDFKIIGQGDIKARPIWEIVGDAGKKVGLINLLFYPAPTVNGFSIAGELTPADELSEFADATYPKSLNQELFSAIGPYYIDAKKFGNPEDFKKNISNSLKQRAKALEYGIKTQKTDFLLAIFNETNRIQHFFWKYQDKNNPEYTPGNPFEGAIREHYRELDTVIGTIATTAGPEATVVLFSNHGFGPLYKTVSVNQWLKNEGFIEFSQTQGKNYAEKINWEKTQAYFPSQFQGIFINRAGIYPKGIVSDADYELLREDIVKKALLLRDPDTDEQIITKAQKREDAYPGANNASLPDIILTFAGGYHASNDISGEIVKKSTYWSGIHNKDGMYIISKRGMGVRQKDAHILDLAPTLLRLLDVSVPAEMKGNPIL